MAFRKYAYKPYPFRRYVYKAYVIGMRIGIFLYTRTGWMPCIRFTAWCSFRAFDMQLENLGHMIDLKLGG